MSVRLRFNRIGRPHVHFYRLVATDRRKARDAKPIEILGTFNPHNITKPEVINLERIKYWLSVGATPSLTVLHTLKNAGLWNDVKPGAVAAVKS
jgi:small subunit ribosomal protein S16